MAWRESRSVGHPAGGETGVNGRFFSIFGISPSPNRHHSKFPELLGAGRNAGADVFFIL